MTGWLKQSTSVSVVIGPIWATANGALKADLAYNASGINCDVYKNGTKADVTLANSAGDGYFRAASGEALYLLTLSTGHTDTLGAFTISLSATGYYMKPQHYMVVPANVWDSMFGSDMLKVDVHSIDDDETAADNLELACDNYSATRGLAGTALPAAAADAAGGLPISDAGALDLDAQVKTAVDAIKAKTDSLTFTVAGDVDCNVQTWKGSAAADMTGDAYARLGAPAGASVSADVAAVKAVDDAIKAKTDNLPASPAATGAAMTLADDAITAAKFDESTAFPLKSADAGATQVARTGADGDTLETLSDEIAAVTAPTAAAVADAVWDEAVADHAGVGSTGAGLAAASSAGDPWATEIPGAYGAGTAGKILGDNLNAPVGTVDTVVDAIKAVTDNLPNSGALTDLATAAALATVDGIVDDILVDTGTTLPGTLSTMDGKLDTIDNFIDTEVAAILEDTGTTLPATLATIEGKIDTADAVADAIKAVTDAIGATGSGLSAVPWNAAWDAEVQSECTDALNAYDPPTKAELDAADDATLAAIAALSIPTATENADALLGRNIAGGSSTGRTVTQALRALRNKVGIADGTMTVYAEDDTTESWTAALTTSASAEPITEIDPA